MTKIYDGQIADLFQNEAKQNPEILSFSFALFEEKRRIIEMAQKTRTIAMIEQLSEDILDVLAVELRTPYYSGDMDIDQKRRVIKNTLLWFFRAGTPAAVRELVSAVFGNGDIEEWFDFTEPPYTPGTFDIVTDARMTEDIVERFLQIVKQVKNTRSHLRRVRTERTGTMYEYVGSGTISEPEVPIFNGGAKTENHGHGTVTAKSGAISAPRETIVNNASARARGASGTVRIGVALAVRDVHIFISNCPPPGTTANIGQKQAAHAAAVARSDIKI